MAGAGDGGWRRSGRRGLWSVLAGAAVASASGLIAFLWPRRLPDEVDAGSAAAFPVGAVRHLRVQGTEVKAGAPVGGGNFLKEPEFHLVRRPDGFVAFWHRCTHLGCVVRYRPDMEMSTGRRVERGLFRCPCHGSTFSRDEGEILFGPAPRSLDVLPVRVSAGRVLVTVRPGSARRRERDDEPVAPARA